MCISFTVLLFLMMLWVGWKPEVRAQVMEVARACSGQVTSGILLLNKC